MIFRDWLNGLEYTLLQGNVDVETEDVIYDSRKAAPGKVFVAMKGIRVDGHSFIPQVLKAGVTVLVTERTVEKELAESGLSEEELKKVTVVMVKEGRHALALLSAARFGHPTKTGDDRCYRNQGKDHYYPYDPGYFTGNRKESGNDRNYRYGDRGCGNTYVKYYSGILRTASGVFTDGGSRL